MAKRILPALPAKITLFGWSAALLASTAFIPTEAQAAPTCSSLAATLLAMPDITKATSVVVPAAGANAAYCNVQINVSDLAGPQFGYYQGTQQSINIGIGLPLNSADGGSGGVQGAWNGRIEDLGGGGYAGSVGSTTSSTSAGYVGSSTDTGHTGSSGAFGLNPDDTLAWGPIRDFAYNGIHAQAVWSKKLTLMYYGMAQIYAYWNGCSTGGRQAHQFAQRYPQEYNGILGGSPAVNWDRFMMAQMWGEVVMNQELGYQITTPKFTAVSAAAIGSCQNNFGGTPDGVIQDPRACTYNANAYVCGVSTANVYTQNAGGAYVNSGTPDTTNCLTAQEAAVINKIWNGPPGANAGQQQWFGELKGTAMASLNGTPPFSTSLQHWVYWIYQNPAWDWHVVTEASFSPAFNLSETLFRQVIGTDDVNLSAFNANGSKFITYVGLADQLIYPGGIFNYYSRAIAANGGLAATQSFYRFFPFPGNGHCGGTTNAPAQTNAPVVNATDLFNALVAWVEQGQAPNTITGYNNATHSAATITRPICKYPDTLTYLGGNQFTASSFTCTPQTADQYAAYQTSVAPNTGPVPVESIADVHDYNADKVSDIVWRDTSGNVGVWLMNGKTFQSTVLGNVPTTWSIVGQRDFVGQGAASVVWRDAAGDVAVSQFNAGGTSLQGMTSLSTSTLTPSQATWSVVATGDFNTDGMGDILWEDNQGNLQVWFMNGSTISSTQNIGKLPANWTVIGADGNGWIFLRNTVTNEVGIWLTSPLTSGTAVSAAVDFGAIPSNWSVAGIGDFNHSGYSGILFRDTSGNVGMWQLQPQKGTVVISSTAILGNVPLSWTIAQTGDFNGDYRADILWTDTAGDVGAWFMNGSTILSTTVYGNVGKSWTIQAMSSE
jgi:hypothetical protein